MKPVIEVNDISKSYQISHQAKASYNTIKDDFEKLLKKSFGSKTNRDEVETFWALKNINFQVNQGEVFGIVGRNGSGKSTLLKILSRIVDPTSGTIKIHGKVASLLEVGTGFHPELTGRENIYFNGSMIGMSKQEITRKFDEIVSFSGVEKFLDTPVKFYSSGMYVRLAFSVAAHLESEILIIDEVLSVGDAQFQKKSLAKMTSIAKEGRTILFVSHSMTSVQQLCSKALLLEKGKVKIIGETDMVTEKYMNENTTQAEREAIIAAEKAAERSRMVGLGVAISKRLDRQGTGRVVFTDIKIESKFTSKERQLQIDLCLNNVTGQSFEDSKVSVDVFDDSGLYVGNLLNYTVGKKISFKPGKNEITVILDKPNLAPGKFLVNCFAAKDSSSAEIFDWVKDASAFEIPEYDFYNTGKKPKVTGEAVYLNYHFEIKN